MKNLTHTDRPRPSWFRPQHPRQAGSSVCDRLILLLFCALGLLLASCGRSEAGGGGVLEAIIPEPSSYDPVKTNKANEVTILSLIHDKLVHIDWDASQLVPGLATTWEASGDKKTWTFTLREDAGTPDGATLTSADVLFSASLYGREDLNSPRRPNLLAGGELLNVTAPDAKTVVFTAAHPAPFLPWSLADVLILERRRYEPFAGSLESWTKALWKTAKPNLLQGYGPFYVEERSPQALTLVANPHFWGRAENGQALPKLRGIKLTLIDDAAIAGTRVDILQWMGFA